MKLKARVADHEHDLQIDCNGEQSLVKIDDRTYDLTVRAAGGDYLIFNGTQAYECRVSANGLGDTLDVVIRGRSHAVTIINPKKLRSGQNSHQRDHGSSEIVAPMPGKVVRLLVEPGAAVEAGAGIVVVEAMKMQNELKCPKAGTVVAIKVKQGDTVNAGDVLAVVE